MNGWMTRNEISPRAVWTVPSLGLPFVRKEPQCVLYERRKQQQHQQQKDPQPTNHNARMKERKKKQAACCVRDPIRPSPVSIWQTVTTHPHKQINT
jgi:hypothetical protein